MPRALAVLILFLVSTFQTIDAQVTRHYIIKYPFDQSPLPAAPDYNKEGSWAALPFRDDFAMTVPSSDIKDGQNTAKADVFYIYPTTYFKGDPWNADVNDVKLNAFTDKMPIMHQVTAFNGSCRIYAPRYRQAHIRAFFNLDKGGRDALDLAYQDVKAAFEYYLAHYNNGRPIVIAAHSQGAWHAIRLVKEYLDNKPLSKQLVCAYLVGMPCKPNEFTVLKPCAEGSATDCFVTWTTFAKGYYPMELDSFLKGAVCVNPITWTMDTTYAPYSKSKGLTWIKFKKVHKQAVAAQINNGVLWIDTPKMLLAKLMRIKIWHVADYNLFWMDIRDNVKDRVDSYEAKQMAEDHTPPAPNAVEHTPLVPTK